MKPRQTGVPSMSRVPGTRTTALRHRVRHAGGRRHARGAALLTALIIVTLVSTLAASMVWQQWRSIQVETAERARAQSTWVLSGALDWARLILREDARAGGPDHLGEPWAVPLAEARLSTFLAADRTNADDGPEAFLAGSIVDAQALYNMRNIVDNGAPQAQELRVLQKLCETAGVAPEMASRLASQLISAEAPATGVASNEDRRPLMPRTYSQLRWLGIDPQALQRLQRYVTLLPGRTPINANTASREVIAAVLDVDLATAERLVAERQRNPLGGADDFENALPPGTVVNPDRVSVSSTLFFVSGRVRLGDRIITERSLVERNGRNIDILSRERLTLVEQAR